LIKAKDMLIARRADTKARADFATWKMMAKLNGASALPVEAQTFLAGYKTLLDGTTELQATEATINLLYQSYYTKMGGVGDAPDIPAHANAQATGNVTAFKRPPAPRPKVVGGGSETKPRLPVALIFACLVVVYVGFRYFLR
jgi:hypothetical protein